MNIELSIIYVAMQLRTYILCMCVCLSVYYMHIQLCVYNIIHIPTYVHVFIHIKQKIKLSVEMDRQPCIQIQATYFQARLLQHKLSTRHFKCFIQLCSQLKRTILTRFGMWIQQILYLTQSYPQTVSSLPLISNSQQNVSQMAPIYTARSHGRTITLLSLPIDTYVKRGPDPWPTSSVTLLTCYSCMEKSYQTN